MVGTVSAFGSTQEFYVLHFLTKSTPSEINWIGSVQLFFQFIVGLAVGKVSVLPSQACFTNFQG